jgi:outer membrane biosynthesis protein TonB
MDAAAALSAGSERNGDLPFKTGMVISVMVHCMVLAGIPLFMRMVSVSARFERPPTFQLVAAPRSLRPLQPAIQKKVSRPPVQEKVKKESVRPVPRENAKPEENLDELASVLDEIPAPARVSAVGDFKYNWYLAQTQEKIERFWNPPVENRNDSVIISFTIYSDGSISAPEVFMKSRGRTLDDLALRAVRLAAPFGKLPPGVSDDRYEMMCTLRPTRD